MITKIVPLFLQDEKWYKYDDKKLEYVLTEEGKNDKEVLKSFNEFNDPVFDSKMYEQF